MSNENNGTIVVAPRAGNVSTNRNVTEHEIAARYPNGDEGVLTVRSGIDRSATADEEFEVFMLTVDPASLTEGLEKDLAKLDAKLADFSGYDKGGQPIYRYNGRERELLVYQYANRRDSLVQARKTRAQAERIQADARKVQAATNARIEAAAHEQAQKLIEQAEIDRRAKQIAARAGVQ